MRLSAIVISVGCFIISLIISFGLMHSGPADRPVYSDNQSEEELQTSSPFMNAGVQMDTDTVSQPFTGYFQSFSLLLYSFSAGQIISQAFSIISYRPPPRNL